MLKEIVAYVNFYFKSYQTNEYNDCFIKSYLVYRYLHEKYFHKTIEMNRIFYRLNNGIIDLLFQTNSNVLKNHLIFSYAFSEFYNYYRRGRGKVYIAKTRLQKSSIIGFITGIVYWFFHEGAV